MAIISPSLKSKIKSWKYYKVFRRYILWPIDVYAWSIAYGRPAVVVKKIE